MRGMGEHVDRLDSGNAVIDVEVMEVAGLCGGVARDVDDSLGGSPEDSLHDVGVHAGTRWIGDDHVRTAMFMDEIVGEDVLHVSSIEKGVGNAIDFRVHLRILDCLGTYSIPMTCFAFFATKLAMVPVPV